MWNAITLVQDLNSCRRVHSGTYIVYNSQATCSNSSFPLTMVTPTFHFFAFHWLCCLFPICYLPKPTSVGGKHLPPSPNSTTSTDHGDIPIITLLILSSAGGRCLNIRRYTEPVGMMTLRWSYLIDVSVNTIRCIHTSRSRLYITRTNTLWKGMNPLIVPVMG